MFGVVDPQPARGSTVEGIVDSTQPASLWARRGATALLVLLVLAALTDLLGVDTEEQVAEDNGYRLELRYPGTARAGLDTLWRVTVERQGGFGDELTLAVTGDYFELFETQGFHPEPWSPPGTPARCI